MFFLQIQEIIPDSVSVVIPTRMSAPDEKLLLTNKFSSLSIKCCFIDGDKRDISTLNKSSRFFERLQKTASINNRIRNSFEAPINFFLMNHVYGLLPTRVLRLFSAYFCIMAYSNLKGSQSKVHILKHPMSNVMLSIPHKYCILLFVDLDVLVKMKKN